MSIVLHRLMLLTTTLAICSSVAAADQQPSSQLPYTPSLDPTSMDRTADPCEDLYQYACGGWINNNPIPDDQSSWSVYGKTYVDNQRYLWGILQDLSANQPQRNANQKMLGDYFAACTDEPAIEALGAAPLDADLQAIGALDDKAQLAALVGRLISRTDASAFFVALGSEQDAEESTMMIGAVYAGGLGLPDRDYYLDTSPDKEAIRTSYLAHLAAMFALLGETPQQAQDSAATIMRIETGLARATLTRVEQRDPYKTYHRMTLQQLTEAAPGFDWQALFQVTGLNPQPWLNLSQPEFVTAMQAIIEHESLQSLQTYLRWGMVNTRAQLLARPFRDQDFAFYGTKLRGIKEQKPRWRTCVGQVDAQLGEALGREFVARSFPPERREQALRMTRQIQQAMAERIDQLAWMSPQTRAQAQDKLNKMRDKIGYPDKWRDYSSIRISRGDYYGNVTRATAFDLQRQLSRIGKPVDRDEWFMTPATVNAYYNPSMNDINFPAGVLMPPLYDPQLDDAPNYGDTGGTIGHELVHGFDDKGRQFDGDGNLRDWWTPGDAEAFEQRAQCIRDQYAGYRVIDDIFINADLTSGEDIADLGGLILAWEAWQKETADEQLAPRDGLSPEQRFFVGFAQWACAAERPESLRLHAATDPHSPPAYRINGVVVNMPEFARAFGCNSGAALAKPAEKICRIW
jgi:putative endopeptidase